MGNFIKKVWMELQGLINSPSSSAMLDLSSSPIDLDLKVSAMRTFEAIILPLSAFTTLKKAGGMTRLYQNVVVVFKGVLLLQGLCGGKNVF